jgi:Ni/Co efflux regulator RcnB
MKRIVCTVLAAGAVALAAAAPARAEPHRVTPSAREASGWDRSHGDEWRELTRARRSFYARWNGNPRERARFERWYARRCEELRHTRW